MFALQNLCGSIWSSGLFFLFLLKKKTKKTTIGNLIGSEFNLDHWIVWTFQQYCFIFHEYKISFHFCILNSFIGVLYFSSLYWYFLKLIPKHFILFGGIVNEIAFLVSFSEHSFLSIIYYWFLYADFVCCNLTELVY